MRLQGIAFLGILSPRYAEVANTPIYKRRSVKRSTLQEDGSRADHSLGVAMLALRICRELDLSVEQQKYAAAWGLLHDLGNWPLSHTAQHAFSELLGVKTKTVREWLVISDSNAPRKYTVTNQLEECGLDPERLLALFRKRPDKELQVVSDIFQSRLTPDMLEGIWRSGRAFGVQKFDPNNFCTAWYHDLADEYALHEDKLNEAIQFWRTKREIYSRFFSSKSAVHFESCWSWAIADFYRDASLSLEKSLEIDEFQLVSNISKHVPRNTTSLSRWKAPVRQRIKKPYPKTLTLKSLDQVFIEESVPGDEYC